MSMHKQVGYSGTGQQYVLSIDGGAPIPLETLSITDNGHPGSGLLMPPREMLVEVTTQGNGMMIWRPPTDELDQLRAQNDQLRSWLSGVQPVEDPEIPDRYWCGVCQRPWGHHAADCPADPQDS